MSFRPDEYVKAQTVEEVVSLLREHGEKAAIVAGGMVFHKLIAKDMVPQVKKLIDISQLDLAYIRNDEDYLRIGATTRLCDIRDASVLGGEDAYTAVREAATMLPLQVVESGTIGGNICAGLPILNFPPVIIALNAQLKVVGPDGERMISADEFYLDYFLTGLQPNEFLTEIRLLKFPQGTASVYQSLKILSLDYPTVNIAVRLTIDGNNLCKDVKIVFGSVGRIPMRAAKAEKKLKGKKLEDKKIKAAVETIPKDIEPISDLRAPAEYRREISKVLAEDALIEAMKRITG